MSQSFKSKPVLDLAFPVTAARLLLISSTVGCDFLNSNGATRISILI